MNSTDIYNIRQRGAVGDGSTSDTQAIRQSLEDCRRNGGGTVYFPPGTYLCGTLTLFDNLTLHLDAGAVLLESQREDLISATVSSTGGKTFSHPHLIHAAGARNIAICGHGEVRGRGASADSGKDLRERGFRSGIIYLTDCVGVRLTDFTIRQGDAWTVHMHGCEEIFLQGVSILNNLFRRGGNDGLDLNCCRNVMVTNCRIEAWDDCIVLKTKDREQLDDAVGKTCENIVVTNCVFRTGCTALKIGSESKGDFRDIHFSNCSIRESSVGFGIYLLDGALVERVSCTNISMEIVPDNRYRPQDEPYFIHIWPICIFVDRRTPESRLGRIRDVILRDIQGQSDYGALVLGHPESPIENLCLENITLRVNANLPYSPRQLPCHQGYLEDRNRIRRSQSPGQASELLPARPEQLPPHQPAYLNIEEVSDLTMENFKIYVTEAAAAGNSRVALSKVNVADTSPHRTSQWRTSSPQTSSDKKIA